MKWHEACQLVKDILFNNSNHVYHLGLSYRPLSADAILGNEDPTTDLEILERFLDDYPDSKFLRIYWTDYTATPRMRAIPMRRALSSLRNQGHTNIGITKASLGLLQNDLIIPGVTATGEYSLIPDFSSIKVGPRPGHASVNGDFRDNATGSPIDLCPRTLLQRVLDQAAAKGLKFQIGFEVEMLMLRRESAEKDERFRPLRQDGHAWSIARSMDHPVVPTVIEKSIEVLDNMGIYVEQVHAESAHGQFELVLPKAPPLEAVDTLLHARNVISSIAMAEGYRMTLHPKPFPTSCGTASHVHLSISSPNGDNPEVYESFYAGILKHLQALVAITLSNPVSYDRVQDGCWAGGRWVAWGTQNRETALRKIEDSHWELKCMDGLANPYLALAAVLAAGANGVSNKEKLTLGDCEMDPATLTNNDRAELGVVKMLPLNLPSALAALQNDGVLIDLLGENVVERYVGVKEAEIKFLESLDGDAARREWIMERY
jgi:glutamine synthetase